MIVGFILVLLAIAGGVAMFAYICRVRQFALRSQYLQRTAAARRTGIVDMPSYPAPLVQLRPVATHTPAAEDEGTVRECPICFEEITQNQEWLLLPCKHGVCATCYQKLIQDQHQVTTCPLCRMPLLEPVPKQTNASSLVTAPGTPTISCPRTIQHMPVITQAPANWFQIHMSSMVQTSAPLSNQHDLQPAGCPLNSIV